MIMQLAITTAFFFFLGAVMIGLIHVIRSSDVGSRRKDWIKYGVFLGVVAGVLAAAVAGRGWLIVLLALIFAVAVREVWRHCRQKGPSGRRAGGLMLVLIVVCGGHLMLLDGDGAQWSFGFLFLLVAMTDSYGQLVGRLAGRRRLSARISPHKTIAGFWGGVGAAVTAATAFRFLDPGLDVSAGLIMGLMVGLAAIAGDLVFSAMKRRLEIKDFSQCLPGHGGVLDRFDSLILAAPVYVWGHYALGLS